MTRVAKVVVALAFGAGFVVCVLALRWHFAIGMGG